MRIHLIPGFPAMLLVARPLQPDHGDQVLAVVNPDTPAAEIRRVARALLPDRQRRELSRFLTNRDRRRRYAASRT